METILKIDDLESLRRALNDLETMTPLDRARTLHALVDEAPRVLARSRSAAFDALAGPGRPMTITALAKELRIHRSRVDEAIKAHRETHRRQGKTGSRALPLSDSDVGNLTPRGENPTPDSDSSGPPGDPAAVTFCCHIPAPGGRFCDAFV